MCARAQVAAAAAAASLHRAWNVTRNPAAAQYDWAAQLDWAARTCDPACAPSATTRHVELEPPQPLADDAVHVHACPRAAAASCATELSLLPLCASCPAASSLHGSPSHKHG